jgi:hypothetical protein
MSKWFITRALEFLKEYRSSLEILGARRVTSKRFHTEVLHILGATMKLPAAAKLLASYAGQVLSKVPDDERYHSPVGWDWEWGSHPHLVNAQLSQNPGNEVITPKLIEAP